MNAAAEACSVRVVDVDGIMQVVIVVGPVATTASIRAVTPEALAARDDLLQEADGAEWLGRISERQRNGESYADLAAVMNWHVRQLVGWDLAQPGDPWRLAQARVTLRIWGADDNRIARLLPALAAALQAGTELPIDGELRGADVRNVLRRFRRDGRVPAALRPAGVGQSRPVLPIAARRHAGQS